MSLPAPPVIKKEQGTFKESYLKRDIDDKRKRGKEKRSDRNRHLSERESRRKRVCTNLCGTRVRRGRDIEKNAEKTWPRRLWGL